MRKISRWITSIGLVAIAAGVAGVTPARADRDDYRGSRHSEYREDRHIDRHVERDIENLRADEQTLCDLKRRRDHERREHDRREYNEVTCQINDLQRRIDRERADIRRDQEIARRQDRDHAHDRYSDDHGRDRW